MKKCFYIGFCGFFGAMLRFFIKSFKIYNLTWHGALNTILVNILGCFIISLVLNSDSKIFEFKEDIRIGITVGFSGALTTFSTLCKETRMFLSKGSFSMAISYVLLNLILGISFIYLGKLVANKRSLSRKNNLINER